MNKAEHDVWFKFFIEITPDATVIVDERGTIRMVNSLAEKLFGYSRDEMLGNPVEILVPESVRAGHPPLRKGFFDKSSVRQMQASISLMAQKKTGELLPVSIGLSPMETTTDGRFVMASIRDNSVLHKAHAAVENAAQEIKNITATANDAIITIDMDSVILSWNPAATRIFGYTPEETIGQKIHLIIPQYLRAKHDDGVKRFNESNQENNLGKTVEFEAKRKGGDIFPVEFSLSTWESENGRVFCGILRDITERKKNEEMLASKEAQLQMIMQNMPGAMIVVDKDMEITLANETYKSYYGHDDETLHIGASIKDVLKAEIKRGLLSGDGDSEQILADRIKSYKTPKTLSFEDRAAAGEWVQLTRTPAPDGHTITVAVDITERKLAEEKLQDTYNLISSSIDYASRIQRSILPDPGLFASLFKDHFVIWDPRDVVGGDLYWCKVWGDGLLVMMGDCTGHGVPGAFMTLITSGALDNAVADILHGQVGLLMKRMHQSVQNTLGQHIDGGASDDGLDLGICYLNADMDQIKFAGARFDLHFVDGEDVNTVKGTKAGIAYRGIPHSQEYEEHVIGDLENKTFYMTTDGFTDQIGGEKKLMFGKRRLRDLLLRVQGETMSDQKKVINDTLMDYQGDERRRDDVSMIGFRV